MDVKNRYYMKEEQSPVIDSEELDWLEIKSLSLNLIQSISQREDQSKGSTAK